MIDILIYTYTWGLTWLNPILYGRIVCYDNTIWENKRLIIWLYYHHNYNHTIIISYAITLSHGIITTYHFIIIITTFIYGKLQLHVYCLVIHLLWAYDDWLILKIIMLGWLLLIYFITYHTNLLSQHHMAHYKYTCPGIITQTYITSIRSWYSSIILGLGFIYLLFGQGLAVNCLFIPSTIKKWAY